MYVLVKVFKMATSLGYSLPILVKPSSRSFLEAAESSKLVDWELDSIKTERDETVGRSLFYFRNLKAELQNNCDATRFQQEKLDEESSTEDVTVWVMGSWGALESVEGKREESKEYTERKCELTKRILTLKIQILCLKAVRISSVIKLLQELESHSGAKTPTPPELQFQKFEDWIQSNEQIYKLQSKILDLEAGKVRQDSLLDMFNYLLLKGFCNQRERHPSISSITTKQSFASVLDAHPGKETETEFMHQFIDEVVISDAPFSGDTALDKLLQINTKNASFESCKLKAYIRECWDVEHIDEDFPTGVHPDRYQELVGGMCQYIVDKQVLRHETLPYDVVYSKLEHHLIPVIYKKILEHIGRSDEDAKIERLCTNLGSMTQAQFGIKPEYQDISLAPYYPAVSALKGITLSLTPTRKIYSVVKAAKLVFEKLNELAARDNRRPPGADEFMDIWVYVVLKSNIPNFISTITYLKKYSNPNLGFTEAGYYLASVEFACQYILRLSEHDFPGKAPVMGKFIVCERERFWRLAAEEDSLFEVMVEEEWLKGYELYAVKEWQLDPTRFSSTVLIPIQDPAAKVQVSIVRINTNTVSPSQLESLQNNLIFRRGVSGLSAVNTALGKALVLDPSKVDRRLTLMPIPNGQYDQYEVNIKWYCTLERLSCVRPCLHGRESSVGSEVNIGTALHDSLGNQNEKLFPNPDSPPATPINKELQFDIEVSPTSAVDTSLKKLRVVDLDSVLDQVAHKDELVTQVYGGRSGMKLSDRDTLSDFTKTLVILLRNLGYISPLMDVTEPYYSNLILLAVRRFQLEHNAAMSQSKASVVVDSPLLPTSGYLSPLTWNALKGLLNAQISGLTKLGYEYDEDPFSCDAAEQAQFRGFVRHCQDSLAIKMHLPGSLGKQTRDEIQKLIEDF